MSFQACRTIFLDDNCPLRRRFQKARFQNQLLYLFRRKFGCLFNLD